MLGSFELRTDDGRVAEVAGARLRGLLAALALETGHVVPKATLLDWIWAADPPADATNALQRLVSRLRKVLPDGAIEGHPDGYLLRAEPDAVDAVRFEHLVGRARAAEDVVRVRLLREALGLWRGGALQDVGLHDSAAFEAAATRLDGLRLSAMEELFDAEIGLGHGADLVAELTDAVAAHPMRERLAGALMRALVAAGRNSEALLVFERTREALADALGVDPAPELSALHLAVLRGEVGGRDDDRKTNLRSELTSYIGKDADVTAVRGLVAEHRLTTLIGPGGSGKTRLATETGRTLLDDLPDGVWLVELAAIGPDGDVAQATLAALRLRDSLLGDAPDAEPAGRVVAALRERSMLLVLDNCEHVIESAATFAHRVLGECRRVRILATSREPLGITGEVLWPVAPLLLPADGAEPDVIEASPAVRLLLERARAVRPDLAADAPTLATLARVCRALDGMPLAIELAAARLRTMSLDQLAHRLDDRFRLLTGGSRTALPRHRTLRAMVDWSWELLTDPERAVLRRLSVFSGGASLDAAERVCAREGGGPEGQGGGTSTGDVAPGEVLDLLTQLTEKSLVVAEGERYRLLGTIKEYAEQRLAEAGETGRTRRAHLDHFSELAETAEPWLRRADQVEWLAVLGAEHDNLGAAMRGALAAGDAAAAMRLAAGAGWYWWLAGHKTEGLELITAATELPGEVPDAVRATVYAIIVLFVSTGPGDEHQAAGWIHRAYEASRDVRGGHAAMGLVGAMERLLQGPEAALTAFEPVLDDDDPWARALARLQLGKMRVVSGQAGHDAEKYLETALAEFRALGERFGISFALTELADLIATRGELARACGYYDEAVAAVAEVGAVDDVIRMRARQAELYWQLGDEDSSAAAIAEAQRRADGVTWPGTLAALALSKAELARWRGDSDDVRRQIEVLRSVLGDEAELPYIRAPIQDLLGYLADDLDAACEHRAAACASAAEAGHALVVAGVLIGVADLALRREQYEQAARLLAASAVARGLPNGPHPDVVRIEREARSRLGDARYAEAAQEGMRANWRELAEVTLAC
ncbi:Predicted ATPase [Jiangella sp. DSM 45060]|nr:Predicted ATPase [Jiangella sp. DSM 45060]